MGDTLARRHQPRRKLMYPKFGFWCRQCKEHFDPAVEEGRVLALVVSMTPFRFICGWCLQDLDAEGFHWAPFVTTKAKEEEYLQNKPTDAEVAKDRLRQQRRYR